MPESQVLTAREQNRLDSLDIEAKRLLEFKSQNIKKNNLTMCPQCATWVNIKANKCPQCTSEISKYTKEVREKLKRLNEVTALLYDSHKKKMELYQQEVHYKPIWERMKDFFSDPQLVQDFKIVLPVLISFFVLILFLSTKASGLVFWLVSVGGGFFVYFLFNKWSLRKYVSAEFYRTALILGLIIVLTSSLSSSMKFWPDASFWKGSVEVQSSSANIREAPSTDSEVITVVYSGEKLKVLNKRGSWYQVRTQTDRSGWIHATMVK